MQFNARQIIQKKATCHSNCLVQSQFGDNSLVFGVVFNISAHYKYKKVLDTDRRLLLLPQSSIRLGFKTSVAIFVCCVEDGERYRFAEA